MYHHHNNRRDIHSLELLFMILYQEYRKIYKIVRTAIIPLQYVLYIGED